MAQHFSLTSEAHTSYARHATLLALLTVAACFRVFAVPFAVDDFVYLSRIETLAWPSSITTLFARRFFSGPLSFAGLQSLFGLSPGWFHLWPVGLHFANSWLLFTLIRRLVPEIPLVATVASVVFVLHPASYTAVSWLAAGFNEIPTLTLTLLATHLTVRLVAGGSLVCAAGAALAVVVAAGFKQHGLLAPLYLAVLGAYVGSRRGTGHAIAGWAWRLGLVLLPMALFTAWWASNVLPQVQQIFQGPYERVLAPASMFQSYLRLLPHSLDPVFPLRESLGYQRAVFPVIDEWVAAAPVFSRAAITVVIAAIIGWAARRLALGPLAVACATILIAGLALPASMPHHLYDYYAYFTLPAASTLLALPLLVVWQRAHRWVGGGQFPRVALSIALLAYALAQGHALHGQNGLVAQAESAGLVDTFVRSLEQGDVTVAFVPDTGRARIDTVNGLSILTLHHRRVRVRFAESGQSDVPAVSSPRFALAALEEGDSSRARLLVLDQAQWHEDGVPVKLTPGVAVVQPIRLTGDEIIAVQFRTSASTTGCDIVYELSAGARATAAPPSVAVTAGRLPCPAFGTKSNLEVLVSDALAAPGTPYLLRLTSTAESVWTAPSVMVSRTVPAGLSAVRVEGATTSPTTGALTYRVVARSSGASRMSPSDR